MQTKLSNNDLATTTKLTGTNVSRADETCFSIMWQRHRVGYVVWSLFLIVSGVHNRFIEFIGIFLSVPSVGVNRVFFTVTPFPHRIWMYYSLQFTAMIKYELFTTDISSQQLDFPIMVVVALFVFVFVFLFLHPRNIEFTSNKTKFWWTGVLKYGNFDDLQGFRFEGSNFEIMKTVEKWDIFS